MPNTTKKQHYVAQAQTKQWQCWTAKGDNTGSLMTLSYGKLLEPKNPENLLRRNSVWSQETENLLAELLDDYIGKARDKIAEFDKAQQTSEEPVTVTASQAGLTKEVQLAMFNYAYLLRARYEAAMDGTSQKVDFLDEKLKLIQQHENSIFNSVSDVLFTSIWDTRFDFPVPDSGFFHFLIEQGNLLTIALGMPITERRLYVIRAHGQNVPIDDRWKAIGPFSAGTLCNRRVIVSTKLAAKNTNDLQQEILASNFTQHRLNATWRLWTFAKLSASVQKTRKAELDYLLSPQLPSDDTILDLFLTREFMAEWIRLVDQNGFPLERVMQEWSKKYGHDPFR